VPPYFILKRKQRHNASLIGIFHLQDSVDIGGGYDTTDSFVDDSELYEDFVPPSVDTEKGGFYINTGELSFVKTANSNSMDIPISKSIKPKIKKQATLHTPKTILANKKLKRAKQQIVASAQRSNDMLKKKLSNYQSNSKSLLADFNKIAPPSETPIITDDNEAPIVPPEVPMESPTVIKQPPILPTDLSQDLQDKIKQLQESITRNQEEYGKLSHKDKSNYDEALIQIHNACKDLRMKTKTAVFEYIAHFMGINRASLTNRIKRIMKKNDQGLLDAPLNQLKEAVNAMMTNLLAKYETEMKEYVAQCGPIPIDTSVDDDSACTDELSETSSRMEVDDKKPKRPRKSFQWTPEIKALLSEVVSLKANIELANADKTRSGEDIMNVFHI
jgi:ubinuclein